jgi:hypothetical protein
MDTQLYASHDSCAVCATGGNLVCCDFCEVAFHATCVPALRPHLPPAGLACVECFTETFPAQRDAYDRLFYQRPLTLPLSATLGPPLGSSVESSIVSPLPDASLTFSQSTPTVPVPPFSDPSPTPRDLRASRRSAIVARTSSAGTNARQHGRVRPRRGGHWRVHRRGHSALMSWHNCACRFEHSRRRGRQRTPRCAR